MAPKPQHLMMAVMSLIVFAFAIAGTADYWFYQIGDNDNHHNRISLWKLSTKSAITGVVNTYKVTSDEFKARTCGVFVAHFKAAEAFAILTVIASFGALIGFVLNITGNKAPIGLALAAVTIVFSMITWAIGAAVFQQKFCPNDITGVKQIHLDQNNHIGVGFEYERGFYFFVIPWVLYVLCFLIAVAMQVLGIGESKDEQSEEAGEEKSRGVTTGESTTEKKSATQEPYGAEEASAEGQQTAEEKKAEDDKKKKAAAQKKADDEEERQAKAEEKEMAKKLNAEDVERRKKIWADLRERLPTDKKDKAQRRQRFDLFKQFDRDNKKHLTPADLSHGCQTVLGLGQLKKGLAHILPKAHANARATRQAKGAPAKKVADENVQRCEFRLVFVNVQKMFDLWFIFDKMDVANSGSVTEAEFKSGADSLKKWGKTVANPKADFAAASSGAKMTFVEFCDYAMANQTEEITEDTDDDESPDAEDEAEVRRRNLADVERRKKIWADLAHRLPTDKKSKEERARRFAYFRDFDTKGNGFLTLADVEAGCETVLGLGQLGKGLHHLLPLAYNSARGVSNVKGQSLDADQHVEKSEMRLLFVYIHQYFDLWFLFDALDETDDGSISIAEFTKGLPDVEKWAGVPIKDAAAEFAAADTGKTGELVFLEFCEWAHHKNTKDE